MGKKDIRRNFKNSVFKRDKYTCRICGTKYLDNPDMYLDAHHITDRSSMPCGGYVKENGISLCKNYVDNTESCHIKAEKYHITNGEEWSENLHPNDLYKLIGSSYEEAVMKSTELC